MHHCIDYTIGLSVGPATLVAQPKRLFFLLSLSPVALLPNLQQPRPALNSQLQPEGEERRAGDGDGEEPPEAEAHAASATRAAPSTARSEATNQTKPPSSLLRSLHYASSNKSLTVAHVPLQMFNGRRRRWRRPSGRPPSATTSDRPRFVCIPVSDRSECY
jgi:hypothetical protein